MVALDNGILILYLKKSGRHDVEVCSHRGAEGSAVACCKAESTNDDGVGSFSDQERDADTDCNDGESGKAVAHDDREQSHCNAVYSARDQLAVFGNYSCNTVCDYGADTCCREQ